MYDILFYGIAIIALLFSNALFITLGFMIARLRSPATDQESTGETPSLHQEIKSVSLSLAALSERLVKLEIQIGQLRDQAGQQTLPLNRGDSEQKSFKVATKLALQGASADEIVELCGLTRGEADLICMLHSSNQVSPNGVANGDFRPQKASKVTGFYEDVQQETPDSDQA
jgi:hypothetical protein